MTSAPKRRRVSSEHLLVPLRDGPPMGVPDESDPLAAVGLGRVVLGRSLSVAWEGRDCAQRATKGGGSEYANDDHPPHASSSLSTRHASCRGRRRESSTAEGRGPSWRYQRESRAQ